MNVNDPTGLDRRLEKQYSHLNDEDIPEADKDAIKAFADHEYVNNNDIKDQSLANYVQNLRLSSRRGSIPLTEMTEKDEFTSLVSMLKREYDLSDETINGYKLALRRFFDYHDRNWATEIDVTPPDKDEVEDWRIFDNDEIAAMIETADDARLTAGIAVLADTGVRIGQLASFRVGDADLEGDVAVLSINTNAPVKDAEGTIPLTFSRGYLSNYLDSAHPQRDRDEVALFHKKEGYSDGDTALATNAWRNELKALADEVGIDPDRMQAHNFRHTCITRWIRQGFSFEVIKHRATWVDGSDMIERYSHVKDEEMNKDIAAEYGLATPDDVSTDPEDSVGQCPVCHTDIFAGSRYCPGCGNPIDIEAANETAAIDRAEPGDLAERLADRPDVREDIDVGTVLAQAVEKDPSLLDDALALVEDGPDSEAVGD